MTVRAEVWGSPVRHSLSPALHQRAYEALGLGWSYGRREVGADTFAAEWRARRDDLAGVSVTMPLKALAVEVADVRGGVVADLGVANTLSRSPEGWRADNTDATAMLRLLGDRSGAVATVVGGGATAASAVWALASRGVREVRMVTRRGVRDVVARAVRVSGVRLTEVPWDAPLVSTLLVLAVPGAARDAWLAGQVGPAQAGTVLDAAYDTGPGRTRDLVAQGWTVHTGLDLLTEQAVDQVFLMTGRRVPASVLRAAVAE